MAKVEEKFELEIGDEVYNIVHEGIKSWKDQKDFKDELRLYIEEMEKEEGFIPYNNFECSIRYKLKENETP